MGHREAKESALEIFKERAIGNEKVEFFNQLRKNISNKFRVLATENREVSKESHCKFLEDNYRFIQTKITANEFRGYSEFLKSFQQFLDFCKTYGPGDWTTLDQEFFIRKFKEGCDLFIKRMETERMNMEILQREKVQKYEQTISELKHTAASQQETLKLELTQCRADYEDLQFKEQLQSSQLERVKTEFNTLEMDLRQKLNVLRYQSHLLIEEANGKAAQAEEEVKQMQRMMYAKDSEYQGQILLLQQKVKYYEENLTERSRKEKEQNSALAFINREHIENVKELHEKYEGVIKGIQQQLQQSQKENSELHRELNDKQMRLDQLEIDQSHQESQVLLQLQEAEHRNQLLRQAFDRKHSEAIQNFTEYQSRTSQDFDSLSQKLLAAQQTLQKIDSHYRTRMSELVNQNALLQQQHEFSLQQVAQAQLQLEVEKKQHQSTLSAFKQSEAQASSRNFEQQLSQLNQDYQTELQHLKAQAQLQAKKYKKKIQQLEETNNELEMRLSVEARDFEIRQLALSGQVETLIKEKTALTEKLEGAPSGWQIIEEGLRKRIEELESELELFKREAQDEMIAINSRSEKSLQQLKSYYEKERQRLQHKMQDEYNRAGKKYQLICEEYEERLKTEQEMYEAKLSDLRSQLELSTSSYTEELNRANQQVLMDRERIKTLEDYLNRTRDNLEKAYKSNKANMDQQNDRYARERQGYEEKIESLMADHAAKNKEITTLKYETEKYQRQLQHKIQEIEELQLKHSTSTQTLQSKLAKLKQTNAALLQSSEEQVSELKRNNALLQQKTQFQESKIADLERNLSENRINWNNLQTGGSSQEIKEYLQVVTLEKQDLELKLEVAKKHNRELKANLAKQVSTFEKEKLKLVNQVSALQNKIQADEERYLAQIQEFKLNLRDSLDNEKVDKVNLHLENENLRTVVMRLERELVESSAHFERENLLLGEKVEILNRQNRQHKTELRQSKEQLSNFIETLTNKSESSNDIPSANEQYYLEKIQQLETQLTNTEKAHKAQLDQLYSAPRALKSEKQQLETQLQHLQQEMAILTQNFHTEKEQLRTRLLESERRLSQSEQSRGLFLLDHEKQSTKLELQKETLIDQNREMQDTIEKLQHKIASLSRENQQLRQPRPPSKGKPASGHFVSFEEFLHSKTSASGSTTPHTSVTSIDFTPRSRPRTHTDSWRLQQIRSQDNLRPTNSQQSYQCQFIFARFRSS